MKLTITEIQRSERNLKLKFVISKKRESAELHKESSIYEIGPFALVRFKFSYIQLLSNIHRCKLSVKYKIRESQKDANVQITATCDVGDKTKVHSIVSHDWLGYMDLYDISTSHCVEKTNIYFTKANITINIMDPPPSRLLYEDNIYSDFHLGTEDSSVPVHRVVMASHSEVFKTMLSGEWKETAKGCLEVKGVTQQTLQHLKDYMYLGSLPEHEDLRPLLLIANCYMMHHLEEACTDKLARTVKPESLLDLIKFAMDNHLPELMFSILDMRSLKLVDAARKATKIQKPELKEVEK